jgi:ribosomal-protein-alanine N-acetyltransferase
MSDLDLRPMRWWDIAPVLEMEVDLFADDAWSAGLLWSELAQHDSRHYVVLAGNGDTDGLLGYAGVAVFGDEAYVQTIGVVRGRWGTGMGSVLLGSLLTTAEQRGAHTIALEVRADNERAHRLYERFGFSIVGVRRGYYQPSGADAHVMIRTPA